jgi:hypothetical protein
MHFDIIEVLKNSKAATALLEAPKRKEFKESVDFYESIHSKLCDLYDSYILTPAGTSLEEQKNHLAILDNAEANFAELQGSMEMGGETDNSIYSQVKTKIAEIRQAIQKTNPKQSDESVKSDQAAINTHISKLLETFRSSVKTEKNGEITEDVKAAQMIENCLNIQRENKDLGGRIALLDPNNPETIEIYQAALDKEYPTAAFRVIEACISWKRHFSKEEDGDAFLPKLLDKFLSITSSKTQKTLPQIACSLQGNGREKNYFSQQLGFLKTAADAFRFDVTSLVSAHAPKPSPQPSRSRASTFFESLRRKTEDKPKPVAQPSKAGYFSRKINEIRAPGRLATTNKRIQDFTASLKKLENDAKGGFRGYSSAELKKAYTQVVDINKACMDKIERYQLPELVDIYVGYEQIIQTYSEMNERAEKLMSLISSAKSDLELPPPLERQPDFRI